MQTPPNNDPDQNHHDTSNDDPIPPDGQHDNREPQLNRANICPTCGQRVAAADDDDDESDNGCADIRDSTSTLSLNSLYTSPDSMMFWARQTVLSHPHTPEEYDPDFIMLDSPNGVATPSSLAVEPGSSGSSSMPSSGTLTRSLSSSVVGDFGLMAAAIGFHFDPSFTYAFEPELTFNPHMPSYFGITGPLPLIEDPVWPPRRRRGRALIECVYPMELESREGSVDLEDGGL